MLRQAGATPAAQRRIAALASQTQVHRAFHWLHLHQPRVRQWLVELVGVPAPPFAEQARAAWFLQRFGELGLTSVHLDGVGNALAELVPSSPQAADAPVLLLSAHLDTVFPEGTACELRAEDGTTKLYAPGISDNGAGLSALLAIAAAMRSAQITPPMTVLFAANVGEEGEGDLRGMRYLFQSGTYAGRVRGAIALEGAGTATVVDRALGSRRLRVSVATMGGHSWTNFGAPNAVMVVAQMLVDLGALELPAEPRTSLNVGRMEGGTSVNSIAASASALLDLRSTDAGQLDRFTVEVQACLERSLAAINARYGTHAPAELSIASIGNRPAAALPAGSELMHTIQAVDRHLNLRTEPRIGSTDANLPLSIGIPAVALAAGGTAGGVHTVGEWYDPANREIALRRILLTVLDTATMLTEEIAHAVDGARDG